MGHLKTDDGKNLIIRARGPGYVPIPSGKHPRHQLQERDRGTVLDRDRPGSTRNPEYILKDGFLEFSPFICVNPVNDVPGWVALLTHIDLKINGLRSQGKYLQRVSSRALIMLPLNTGFPG